MRVEINFSPNRKVQETIVNQRWVRFVRKHIPRPVGLWAVGGWASRKRTPLKVRDHFMSLAATQSQAKQS